MSYMEDKSKYDYLDYCDAINAGTHAINRIIKNVDINRPSDCYVDATLLMVAIHFEDLNAIKYLLDNGATTDYVSQIKYGNHNTALGLSRRCSKFKYEIMLMLIEAGADVNQPIAGSDSNFKTFISCCTDDEKDLISKKMIEMAVLKELHGNKANGVDENVVDGNKRRNRSTRRGI